ncbi:MAG: hypothetical protein R3Y64_07705 [Peptostreptococcaceae bacterium]
MRYQLDANKYIETLKDELQRVINENLELRTIVKQLEEDGEIDA